MGKYIIIKKTIETTVYLQETSCEGGDLFISWTDDKSKAMIGENEKIGRDIVSLCKILDPGYNIIMESHEH